LKNLLALAQVDANSLWRQWSIAWVPMHAYTSLLFCMRREAAGQRIIIDNFALQFLLKKRSKGESGICPQF
jgi:hypothetical protein